MPAAMSVRCWAPANSIAATPSYAAARAAGDVVTGRDDREHPAAGGDQVAVADGGARRGSRARPSSASASSIPVITSPEDDDSG